jgi:surface carbohydrate biosynthesis protein
MRTRVALVVDHPIRDLPGLALTAFELCQHGVDCYLVPMNVQGREIWLLAPDFVLLPHLRRYMEDYYRRLIRAGIRYGVLDTEGGFFGNLRAHGDLLTRDRAALGAVRCMCVWGQTMADYLREEGFFSKEQLTVTGLPRYDFYIAPWHEVPKSFLPADLERVGRMVLINTKVAIANPQFTTPEQDVETYTNALGLSREVAMRHWEVGLKTVAETIALARSLADDFGQAHFVLRPHPHERLETYAEGFGNGHVNLEARKEGAVDGWILRASALIHRHCSTAIEAGLAGVPALSPQWIPSSQDAPDTEAVSVSCQSYGELRDVLRAILDGQFTPPPQVRSRLDEVIAKWLHAVDGNSHSRVSKAILDALPHRREVDERLCRAYLYGSTEIPKPWSASGVSHYVKRAMSLPPNWSFRSFKVIEASTPLPPLPRGKVFTAEEVRRHVDEIGRAAAGRNGNRRSVAVTSAYARGDFLRDAEGYSVALYAE